VKPRRLWHARLHLRECLNIAGAGTTTNTQLLNPWRISIGRDFRIAKNNPMMRGYSCGV
jgi:hypothetical protein